MEYSTPKAYTVQIDDQKHVVDATSSMNAAQTALHQLGYVVLNIKWFGESFLGQVYLVTYTNDAGDAKKMVIVWHRHLNQQKGK